MTFAQPERDATGAAIDLCEVRFSWPGKRPFWLNIDDFKVWRGESLLLIGPSGAGKSTLLSLLCGVIVAQQGQVRILGTDLKALSAPARDRYRAEHMGIIFQMFNLLPYGSVLDNVLLPLGFAPLRRERVVQQGHAQEQACRLLSALGLDQTLFDGPPAATLSVGQQQRIAAARALIGDPEIVLADEPTSALDSGRQAVFLDLLFEQVGNAGATLVMVSHDERLTERFDRVVPLVDIARTKSWCEGEII
jgi:putative ABC transport system ATP-binding protein